MKVNFLGSSKNWQDVKDAAMNTIGKDTGKPPSEDYKRRLLLCEHSPIRLLKLQWVWKDLKSWVSVHFVRHKYGIEHWVSTQREDRNTYEGSRDTLEQGSPVSHRAEANAQAIINISRKRLCTQASPETRWAWQSFLDSFKYEEPALFSVCVPDCIYRGHCYEMKSCGYHKTVAYKAELAKYRENINQ